MGLEEVYGGVLKRKELLFTLSDFTTVKIIDNPGRLVLALQGTFGGQALLIR